MSSERFKPAENESIRKLPPTDPEARDEGPRLIPLPEQRQLESPVANNRRYIDLADSAIRRKEPASARPKAVRSREKGARRQTP
jgi:hypothetical protein